MKVDSSCTAFITGGVKGIGLAIAEELLSRGARVWIVDLDLKALSALQTTLRERYGSDRVYTSSCDVTDDKAFAKSFQAAVELFGIVRIVVNNAGFGEKLGFTAEEALKNEILPAEWDSVLDVCLKSVINGTRLAVAHLLKVRKAQKASSANSSSSPASPRPELGVIINIASMGGLHPMRESPIYCAAKHGVVGFSRSLKSVAPAGIRVNALCPSFVDTALVHTGMRDSPDFKKTITGFLNTFGPLLTTKQIADAALLIVENEGLSGAAVSVSRELGVAQHFVVPNTPSPFTKVIIPAQPVQQTSKL